MKKIGVFTVTCLEKNGLVARKNFFQSKQLKCTFGLSLCLTSIYFVFIKDKRSKITDYLWKFSTFHTFDAHTCGNLVLFALLMPVDYQFLSCFVNNVFGKFGEKVYSCGGLERVGRVTVNTAFFFCLMVIIVYSLKCAPANR